jgi:hypothetical protein
MKRRAVHLLISAIPLAGLAGAGESQENRDRSIIVGGKEVSDMDAIWWLEEGSIWLKINNKSEDHYLIENMFTIWVELSKGMPFGRIMGRELWSSPSFFVLAGCVKSLNQRSSIKVCLPLNDDEMKALGGAGVHITSLKAKFNRIKVSDVEHKKWIDEFGGLRRESAGIECRPG